MTSSSCVVRFGLRIEHNSCARAANLKLSPYSISLTMLLTSSSISKYGGSSFPIDVRIDPFPSLKTPLAVGSQNLLPVIPCLSDESLWLKPLSLSIRAGTSRSYGSMVRLYSNLRLISVQFIPGLIHRNLWKMHRAPSCTSSRTSRCLFRSHVTPSQAFSSKPHT